MSENGVGLSRFVFKANGTSSDFDIEGLCYSVRGGGESSKRRRPAWNLSPDYQRPAVWTKEQQSAFVGHILGGGIAPAIFVQRDESDTPFEVIDGQQRLRAILAFEAGEIPALVYDALGEAHTIWWRDFNRRERLAGHATIKVIFVAMSRADRLRFYLRLNSGGTPHSGAELERVRNLLKEEPR